MESGLRLFALAVCDHEGCECIPSLSEGLPHGADIAEREKAVRAREGQELGQTLLGWRGALSQVGRLWKEEVEAGRE
jgi:hypothetical protein